MVRPFTQRTVINGMSYGLGPASYDVRVKQHVWLRPNEFALASTIEHFDIPPFVSAQVADKSTWARRGLTVFNTFIDPGWKGYLTLELKNLGNTDLCIQAGSPIAQIIFSKLDYETDIPYRGKYYNQDDYPVGPMLEQ